MTDDDNIDKADADDLPAIKALLSGMKKRHTETGDVPIFIHTVRALCDCTSPEFTFKDR